MYPDVTSGAVHPDLKAPIYTIVVAHGGEEGFESMLKLYHSAELHEEKVRALRSLGFARKPELVQQALDFCLSDAVRSQDTVFLFSAVAYNSHAGDAAWQFLTKRWAVFHDRYGKGGFMLNSFISSAVEVFTEEERLHDVRSFFSVHPIDTAQRTLAQSMERVKLTSQWVSRDANAVAEFLNTA